MIRAMGLIRGLMRTAGRGAVAGALIASALLAVGVLRSNAELPPICLLRAPVGHGLDARCSGHLLLEAEATFMPTRLQRSGREPIAFHLESKVSAEGEHLPALREAQLDLDKRVEINAEGFSACPMAVTAHDAYARALQSCGDAIVGLGVARVEVVDPESGALRDASLPLTVFKGGVRGESTTLLFRVEHLAPWRSPLLAVAKSQPLEWGRFGTRVTIAFPRIADGNGSIVSLGFGLRRRAPGEGVAGVMRASCPDGHLAFRLTEIFADGTRLAGASLRSCTAAP